MRSKNVILSGASLYAVLDADVADFEKLFRILKETVRAGAGIIQIRAKHGSAREISAFVKKALRVTRGKALLIVNDRADLAKVTDCDGVHVGQDDLSVAEARVILGAHKVVGVSCQTLAQAVRAEREGADYIGFGSVFKTLTKPGRQGLDLRLIRQVEKKISIPIFWIGGITLENLSDIMDNGGNRVAVTRAVCLADDVGRVARDFIERLS